MPDSSMPSGSRTNISPENPHTLLNNLPGMVYRCLNDDNWTNVYIGETCLKLTGYAPSDFIENRKISWPQLIHPDDLGRVRGEVQLALKEERPFQLEYRIRTATGEEKWLSEQGRGIYDSSGELEAIEGYCIDTTERKRSESALRESISLLEGTLESTGDGILVVDLAGKIVRFNQKFTSMWRIPESILESRDDQKALDWVLNQLKHPDQFMDKVRELYSQPEAESYDILEFKDERIFERYSQPQRIGGWPVGRVWSFRDVTDRKRAEWALSRSEKKNWALLDAIPDLIFQINRDGTYLDFLDFKASKETGLLLAPDQFLGKKMQDVLPEEVSRPAMYYMRKALETGKTQTFEYPLEIEGKMQSYEARLAVCGKGEVLAIVRDITDQKRSETDLRVRANQQSIVARLGQQALAGGDILSLMNEAVQSVAQTLNVEFAKILELVPGVKDLILRAGVGWKEGLVGQATVSGGTDSQAGYTLVSDGPVVVQDLSQESRFKGPSLLLDHGVVSGLSVIIPASDRVYGVLGAHTREARSFSQTDVHFLQSIAHVLALAVDRKRVEDEIRRLNNELEQRVLERTAELAASNKELEAFSYSVSHDLTAPLRAINGFSQALLEDYNDLLDKTGKQHLQQVCSATLRMSELIDDLLNLSRVTRSEMVRTPVDLTRLAESVVAELKETQPDRAIKVVIAKNLMTQGDPRLLRIMLENLLGNAWKFTGKTARARIEFGKTKHEGRPVFRIRDNGAGFDMAYAGKLFNAFQRLHGANEFPGTGIGLAIVQRITLRHGGQIWAEAEPEKGATFYFSFS